MERENQLPDVILLSQAASELLEKQTTDVCACVDADAQGISFKSSCADCAELVAEYRNIDQLWHPAAEKPHRIGLLLCWCRNETFFVHDHYSDNDQYWRMFVGTNDVDRYCYISSLQPDFPSFTPSKLE